MAPIFVGSNDDNSRVRSDRVGFAISTSNPGSASEGDAYYNSSDSQLNIYDGSAWASAGAGGNSVELVASGSLSDGQTAIIQSDGTVKAVTTTTQGPNGGTSTVFDTNYGAGTIDVAYASSNKIVAVYKEFDFPNYYGHAVVGTISSGTISFGSPVQYNSLNSNYNTVVYDPDNDKVVVMWKGQSEGRAAVGTISGTSISFGSDVQFENGITNYISAVYDTNADRVVIAYQDASNSKYGTAVVGEVSGTSISFGTPVVFESATTNHISACFDSDNNKVIIAYQDGGNSYAGTAIVGTVSGSSISFGSPTVFNATSSSYIAAAYDTNAQKVIVAYNDAAATPTAGAAVHMTVSGTSLTNTSFAPAFNSSPSPYISAVYNPLEKHTVIFWNDQTISESFSASVVPNGATVGYGTTALIHPTNATFLASSFDTDNNRVILAFQDSAVSGDPGRALVWNSGITTTTNLTANNFLGFSDAAYSDGQTAKIQIAGSVDDAQSGLTTAKKHYVQNDGTLGITTDDPVVLAGTAISGTKIIVLG